jgi:predicted DCC family thiol-disulfide oxidoreductase YuxK
VCDLCHTSVGWIAARDRAGRFEYLPGQGEEARRRYPDLDPAALERALHVVAPDGTVQAGAEALPVILRGLPGPGWLMAARVLELPPVMALARPVYAWVARRRHRSSTAG